MFKFLHAADLHLDSPLRGLERYEGAPVAEIRAATRRAMENLVRLACDEAVDFVLIAGDLYDGDRDDYQTVLFFSRQLVRLQQAGIAVLAISGNHDAANRMTKSLRLPDNFRLLSPDAPETIELERVHVAVHGQGFRRPAETDNLVLAYPPAVRGRFNIGLLHTSLTGAEGHEPYAPCTLADLQAKGYDYWALGHIHQRAVVHEDPWVVFAGNPQGRHIRETGAKGCLLVTVNDALRGRQRVSLEFRPLDVFRWERCEVAVDGVDSPDEIVGAAAEALSELVDRSDQRPVAARLILRGATAAHPRLLADSARWSAELRAAAQRVAADRLWLEKVSIATRLPAASTPAEIDGPLAEVQAYLAELRGDPVCRAEIASEFADLQKRLPPECFQDRAGLPAAPELLESRLDEVEQLLLARLFAPEGS